MFQHLGGGGGGGRIALYATESYSYRGKYDTYGGKSHWENGGSGTVFVSAPTTDGSIETSLYLDNRGYKPLNEFISDPLQDSGRSYLVAEEANGVTNYTFDHVHMSGASHFAVRNVSTATIPVFIRRLHGDRTVMLHTSKHQPITIETSITPFPASFRVYDKANLTLPRGKLHDATDYYITNMKFNLIMNSWFVSFILDFVSS